MITKRDTSRITVTAIIVMLILSSPTFLSSVTAGIISLTVDTDKSNYFQGEHLLVSGQAMMSGSPLMNTFINITIKGPDDGTVRRFVRVQTDYSGFYSLDEILYPGVFPLGRYNVTVAVRVATGYEYGYALETRAWKTFNVVAVEAEEAVIRVSLEGGGWIANASVILYNHFTGHWVNSTKTNSTGVAVLGVPASTAFDVLIYKTGYGKTSGGRTLGYLFADNSTTGYTSPCSLSFELQSVAYGSVRGSIVNATDSEPLGGAMVSLLAYIRGKTYWVESTTTLDNGTYSTGLNIGLWRIWVDRKENGNVTHIGTWKDVAMTDGASKTVDLSLWPKAQLTIESLPESSYRYDVVLINDTYGGAIWRRDVGHSELPLTVDIPAISGIMVVIGKHEVYGTSIEAHKGSTVTLSAELSNNQYDFWAFPNDSENNRLLGNLTMVAYVVAAGTGGPGDGGKAGPPQFVDPVGTVSNYLMADRGSGIPTVWSSGGTMTRTGEGSYYRFFDLDTLDAPQGYFYGLTLVRNSTGHVVAADPTWFNRFQYQIQVIKSKGTYDVGEDADFRFKVYSASGYATGVTVAYGLYDGTWRFVRGGYATVNSTTRVWNVTLPSGTLSTMPYHLVVRIIGGREQAFHFAVQDYTPIRFSGRIIANATMSLYTDYYGTFVVTANRLGIFNTTLPQGYYNAWFQYDNKVTPGVDARDTSTWLYLYSNVTNFPEYFWDYLSRPIVPAFEVRGIVFHDANRNGRFDAGEARLPQVNVRATNITGWQEWFPPSLPDGSYRLLLQPLARSTWSLKATVPRYELNESAVSDIAAGTPQGSLLTVNLPMVSIPLGNITGYVKLDNGTALQNAWLHFMDQYWSWLGSTSTNSTGGYLFVAPAGREMNVWIDPGVSGWPGKDIRGIIVAADRTLYLNVTFTRPTWVSGRLQINGTDVGAQIMPLDENWNRLTWETWQSGSFNYTLPVTTKRLLMWAWGQGFLIKDVDLHVGVNNLGVLNLTATSPVLSLNVHPKNWAWEWLAGQRVDFEAELRNTTMWEPVQGGNLTFWAWYWNNGSFAGHGTVPESSIVGTYEGNFTPMYQGHYKVLVLANVSGSVPKIAFNDFWVSATDKKLYLIRASGEYGLDSVQAGNAKVRAKLLSTIDGSGIAGYPVWYEIRGFTNIAQWWMETVVTRTRATDVGGGIYEIILPTTLGNGSYWMEILAGDWETTQHVGFTIETTPTPTVNIYGWVTRSPTPASGAIIEGWMEAKPYRFVATTNASGYYSLPVPQKNAYHLHIFWDNVTTPGIDYTTVPEWNRVEVKVINVLNNATIARLGSATLSIIREGQPAWAEVRVWDSTTQPHQLLMWSGTWRGNGLFEEKIKEGRYTFEVGSFWGTPMWIYWWQSPLITADQPLKASIVVPVYNATVSTWIDTSNVWRAKPGDNITMRIWESYLIPQTYGGYGGQQLNITAAYLLQNCTSRLEAFHWVPGKMAEGFAYNTTWVQKQHATQGKYLELNFTIPEYFGGGDWGIFAFFYNTTAAQKVLVKADAHLMISVVDMGLTVVPYTVSPGDKVMAAAVLMMGGEPAQGAEVAFEIYNGSWQLETTIAGAEVAPGIYTMTYTIPTTAQTNSWWTIKTIATVQGKEAIMYQGFSISP